MKWDTWEAIARRQAQYKMLLDAKIQEWPPERVDAQKGQGGLVALVQVAKLTARWERHYQRMDRHMARGLALLPVNSHVEH